LISKRIKKPLIPVHVLHGPPVDRPVPGRGRFPCILVEFPDAVLQHDDVNFELFGVTA